MRLPDIRIRHPDWMEAHSDLPLACRSEEEMVGLAVALARENVLRGTGGPFGAAVFELDSGRLVAAGVNSVVRLNNCTLHAEMMAIQAAQASLGCYSLRGGDRPDYALATSCEPCAMCLGASLWSGVGTLLCGATREDAEKLGFDEGPVFPASYRYLAERGVRVVFGVRREEARAVLELYRERGGEVYNA